MRNQEIVNALKTVFDNNLSDKVVWWLTANHPEVLVEAVQHSTIATTPKSENLKPETPDELKYKIQAMMYNVHLIAALDTTYGASSKVRHIKAYRTITGAGLREAKDWVEEHYPEFALA